ncbi:hypothetical protein ACSS6W_008548 [Trichoderma asperelloides]
MQDMFQLEWRRPAGSRCWSYRPDAPETAQPWWPDGALFPGTGMQGHARNARAFSAAGMKLMGVK